MSAEKQQPEGARKGKLRFLSREEKQRLVDIMLGKGPSQNGITPKKSDKPDESGVDEKPIGGARYETPQWVYDMAKRYGEPTVSLDELREMLDKELDGESLSDFLIQDRRKNPY